MSVLETKPRFACVRDYRDALGIPTQTTLARLLSVRKATVCGWEVRRHETPYATLMLLELALQEREENVLKRCLAVAHKRR